MENLTVEEKLTRARTLLVLDHPFFGCLALKLSLVEDSSIETAAVDDKIIYYNPEWIDKLTKQEVKGILAHLVMHVALGHHWRKESREEEQWQKATDYAINPILVEEGMTLPKEALVDNTYKDKSAEEIYKLFPTGSGKGDGKNKKQQSTPSQSQGQSQSQGKDQQQKQDSKSNKGKNKKDKQDKKQNNQQSKQQKDDGSQNQQQENKQPSPQQIPDPGKCGSVVTAKNKERREQSKVEWKMAVSQAMQLSKGNLPLGLQRELKEVIDPPLPWTTLLRDFVERTARNDFNWSRPNQRYATTGIILPSLINDQLPDIVIAIDTSGSISNEQLNKFANEVSNVLEAYETKITVIFCDAAVQKVQEFSRVDLPLKLEPKGGGGTDFRPVFKYVEKNGITPACLIYLTDLYGTFPESTPEYPMLWVATSKKTVPFGTRIDFE